MTALGRRYARAAVDAADEKGGASAVEALAVGLLSFRDAYKASNELRELLNNPVFEVQREQVLGKVLDTMKASDQVKGLIRLLAERGRIGILDSVAAEVEGIARAAGMELAFQVIGTVRGEILHNHFHGNIVFVLGTAGDIFESLSQPNCAVVLGSV